MRILEPSDLILELLLMLRVRLLDFSGSPGQRRSVGACAGQDPGVDQALPRPARRGRGQTVTAT